MKVINVEGMHCEHCAKRVKEVLSKIDNVSKVVVNLSKHEVIIYGDDIDDKIIKKNIEDLDYQVKKIKEVKDIVD